MSKNNLMNHRKASHPDIIKQCRYFVQGNCSFQEDVCWYHHKNKEEKNYTNISEEEQDSFTCNLCKHNFKKKDDFMKHRKQDHPQIISKFRDFNYGECRFSAEECWYNHNESSTNKQDNNSFFWKYQENHQPPDLMKRIIDMMEQLVKKVEVLERRRKILLNK